MGALKQPLTVWVIVGFTLGLAGLFALFGHPLFGLLLPALAIGLLVAFYVFLGKAFGPKN